MGRPTDSSTRVRTAPRSSQRALRPVVAAAGLLLVLLLAVLASGRSVGARYVSSVASRPGVEARTPSAPARRAASGLARAVALVRRDKAPGRVAVAVALPGGSVSGLRTREVFRSASLSKSLLAITLLRSDGLSAEGPALRDAERMIEESDNAAATRTLRRVGAPAVRRTTLRAGMRDYVIGDSWSESLVSARDFAVLFVRAPSLVPRGRRRMLETWLENVVASQTWGIPRVMRPAGVRVLFKGGWRSGLVHQAAHVEFRGQVAGIAVLTDGQPSMSAGVRTIEHVAARVLAGLQAS